MKHPQSSGSVSIWQEAGFGLYIHWPFCQAKCPYCDFNSHVVSQIDQGRWLRAYKVEIHRLAAETKGRVLRSIFFGGGTPSLMSADVVSGIIDEAARAWVFSNDIEITLEANPTSIEAGKFADFKSAGVNRVSVGVQALNDTDLRKLGRMHSASEAIEAVRTAQKIYERTSFDLIYARQNQSLDEWRRELRFALALGGEHLSVYQLTIEDGTVFGARHAQGQLRGLPAEDLSVDMYLLTQELCENYGLPAYEVSNHARPGSESRHNTIYWNCGDYIGIGPGAHGRITDNTGIRRATECPKAPGDWLNRVENGRPGENDREVLRQGDQIAEAILMGMRQAHGIDIERFASRYALPLNSKVIEELTELGYLRQAEGRISTTRNGTLILNSIIAALSR